MQRERRARPAPQHVAREREAGQIMLLTAVLLIFAFLALSAMLARVQQLGYSTTADQDRLIFSEADAVQQVVDDLVVELAEPGRGLTNDTYVAALEDALRHLQVLQAAHGLRFDWQPLVACAAATPSPSYVLFTLADGEVSLGLQSSVAYRPCQTPPAPPPGP